MFISFLSCDVTATALGWSERQPASVTLYVCPTVYRASSHHHRFYNDKVLRRMRFWWLWFAPLGKHVIDDAWSQHRGILSGIRLEGCLEISLWLQHRIRYPHQYQRHSASSRPRTRTSDINYIFSGCISGTAVPPQLAHKYKVNTE